MGFPQKMPERLMTPTMHVIEHGRRYVVAKPLSTIISLFPINLQRLMPECDPLHSYLRQLNKSGVGRPDAICFARRGEVPSFRSTAWDTIGVPSPVRNFPAMIRCADAICVCAVATPAPQMMDRHSSYLEEIRPFIVNAKKSLASHPKWYGESLHRLLHKRERRGGGSCDSTTKKIAIIIDRLE